MRRAFSICISHANELPIGVLLCIFGEIVMKHYSFNKHCHFAPRLLCINNADPENIIWTNDDGYSLLIARIRTGRYVSIELRALRAQLQHNFIIVRAASRKGQLHYFHDDAVDALCERRQAGWRKKTEKMQKPEVQKIDTN